MKNIFLLLHYCNNYLKTSKISYLSKKLYLKIYKYYFYNNFNILTKFFIFKRNQDIMNDSKLYFSS